MLTQKQERFVQELIKGKSQREAYIAAFGRGNYSDQSLDVEACKLLKTPKVSQRYEELREAAEAQSAYTAAEIRAKLIDLYAKTAFTDLRDYYVIEPDATGQPALMLRDDFLEYDGAPIKGISYDARGNIRVEVYDRMQAADKLRELYGITQQTEDGSVIRMDGMDAYDN